MNSIRPTEHDQIPHGSRRASLGRAITLCEVGAGVVPWPGKSEIENAFAGQARYEIFGEKF
jgi:hypothetical protein